MPLDPREIFLWRGEVALGTRGWRTLVIDEKCPSVKLVELVIMLVIHRFVYIRWYGIQCKTLMNIIVI